MPLSYTLRRIPSNGGVAAMDSRTASATSGASRTMSFVGIFYSQSLKHGGGVTKTVTRHSLVYGLSRPVISGFSRLPQKTQVAGDALAAKFVNRAVSQNQSWQLLMGGIIPSCREVTGVAMSHRNAGRDLIRRIIRPIDAPSKIFAVKQLLCRTQGYYSYVSPCCHCFFLRLKELAPEFSIPERVMKTVQ